MNINIAKNEKAIENRDMLQRQKPRQASTIVLCAGKLSAATFPVNGSMSVGMLPINGKPVMGWILDDLFQKNILNVVIVVRAEDRQLKDFVRWAYGQRMNIRFASPRGRTILHSLQAGLRLCRAASGIRIVLGDTLIRDDFDAEDDFVYTGQVEDSRRWCLATVSADGIVQDYIEKPEHFSIPQAALAGYYRLANAGLLRSLLRDCLRQGARELSDVLRRYGQVRPIYARQADEWYDFGHIDNLVDARRRLLQPRFFNALVVNPVLNTITKTSQNSEKLQNELDWYLSLPEPLQVLAPRILRHNQVNDQVQIVQEYYGYPTLAELYVYGNLESDLWEAILRKVMHVHRAFQNYNGEISHDEIWEMYLGKTQRRLNALAAQDTYWRDVLSWPCLEFNGQTLKNISLLLPALRGQAQALAESASVHIIHGDFCFSNILFDINHQIIRLIDPRGYFGRKGIYGDPRYDVAKLRHSISGLYDFILAGLFTVEETSPGVFSGKVFANQTQDVAARYFDSLLIADGYSLAEIRLIEGLLFVSMLPYHGEDRTRQKILYLRGLTLLNEVLA